MPAHQPNKMWVVGAVTGLVVVCAVGVWLVSMLRGANQSDISGSGSSEEKATTQTLSGTSPQLLTTSDALLRYVQDVTKGDTPTVDESHIYYPKAIDWNTQTVVALQFLLLNAKTVTGASIDTVNGQKAYVIDVLDVSQCGAVPQVSSTHLALIAQTSSDTALPVVLRTTPNTASCDELR